VGAIINMKLLFMDFTLPFLLMDTEHPIGGWAIELSAWLKGIVDCDQQAAVLTRKGGTQFVDKELNFELFDTYDPGKGLKFFKYFYYYIPVVLKAARNYQPDFIIQACCGFTTGILAFVSDLLGVPFIYRVANDMDADERYKERLSISQQLVYRYGLRRAAAIICQNQYQYDCLKRQFPRKPLHIIHNPFDTKGDAPDIRERPSREYFAWIGVFSHQKNLRLLHTVASMAPEIQFRVAGMPYENIDEETDRALDDLAHLPNVRFVGYLRRRDVPDFLAGAIALLNTSRYEGFSNTFLESLAVGTPIIAPRNVDPDQFINSNNLGLTTENEDEIVDLMRRICELALEDYDDLTTRCQRYVSDHHAPEAKAKELLQAITPLLDRS
jgi:glycosyltransferase involved in cell wall biosynthesis